MGILKSQIQSLALIALGSNLGDSRELVLRAMERLQSFSDLPLLRSSLWETAPIDCPPSSPRFVNAVVGLKPRTDETPQSLLVRLHKLEQDFGRRAKEVLNEPRPLDLDLISFGGLTLNTEQLKLPHPRAHQRRFVLAPLNEIAPELILPLQTKTIRQLLAESDDPGSVLRISWDPAG